MRRNPAARAASMHASRIAEPDAAPRERRVHEEGADPRRLGRGVEQRVLRRTSSGRRRRACAAGSIRRSRRARRPPRPRSTCRRRSAGCPGRRRSGSRSRSARPSSSPRESAARRERDQLLQRGQVRRGGQADAQRPAPDHRTFGRREVRVLDDAEDVAEGILHRRDADPAADVLHRLVRPRAPSASSSRTPRRRPRRPSTATTPPPGTHVAHVGVEAELEAADLEADVEGLREVRLDAEDRGCTRPSPPRGRAPCR